MDFDDFFSHPFLRALNYCDKPSSGRSQNPSQTNFPLVSTEKTTKDLSKPHPHLRVARLKEEVAIENLKQQQRTIQAPANYKQKDAKSQPRSPSFADDSSIAPLPDREAKPNEADSSGSDNFEDFVMINDDVVSTIVTPTTPSQATTTTAASSLPQRILNRTLRPLVNYTLPEPLPVPTQRAAYEQIQRSVGSNSSSIGVIQESDSEIAGIANNNSAMMTSPPATPPQNSRFRRTGAQIPSPPSTLNLKRQDSCSSIGSTESGCSRSSRNLLTDVSQMSPPSVNFVLGSSPPGIAMSPNASSYALNRSRRLSVPHSPNPSQISPAFFNWYFYILFFFLNINMHLLTVTLELMGMCIPNIWLPIILNQWQNLRSRCTGILLHNSNCFVTAKQTLHLAHTRLK